MALLLDLWGDWLWFAGVALTIVTVIVTLVYVLSELLLNEKMKTWAKMELVEILYSAIIIAMAIGGIQAVDSVVQGALLMTNGQMVSGTGNFQCDPASATSAYILTTDYGAAGQRSYQCLDICGDTIAQNSLSVYHGIESCHMRLGIWYLREVFNEVKDFAFLVYIDYIKTSMIAEFTINIEFLFEKAGFFTFTPWKGFYTMGNTIKELCFDWSMKIMTITKFQEVVLKFIATSLFPALFVIGVLLRTFTLTRRLGGLLLAMAICFYFIFPAFYSFGALVMLDLKDKAYQDWVSVDNPANPANLDADPLNSPLDFPDPPIANTMYVGGDFAMVGGSGTFSTADAISSLWEFEGKTPQENYEAMEQGDSDYIMDFDLNADVTATDEEKDEKLKEAYESGQAWFNAVSKESKVDQIIDFAWEENGPIATLSRLTFWSVFFSLFSVIGTIAGIRSLSITFGGDIEIAGLTRLI